LSDLYVRGVLADRSGNVWVGTTFGGLFQLTGEKFQRVTNWQGIAAIYQDRRGLLWFGTDEQGLYCRDSGKVFTSREGLCANAVQALVDDAQSNLWIGTKAGLNVLRAGQLAAFHKTNGLPSEDVLSLYVDAENILWVGTSGGLARFDGTHWTRYTKDDGLKSNRIGYLAEDGEHYVWIGSPGGLMRVSKQALNQFARGEVRTINCRPFGLEDGLPTSRCSAGSQPAAAIGPDGTLWVPTVKGLVSVRPAQLYRNTNPPPVRIERVKVQGQLQNTNGLRALPPVAVTIPANKEGLEIDYTSLNLSAPEKARFKYRMEIEGRRRETNWIEAGNVRVAQFPTLLPGHHRFEVTACNEDGVWNETGSALAVTVLPPFWRTTWFLTVATLGLLGFIVLSVYYVSTQRLQRQVAALRQQEALEKERARIARDLHDQLGANLTQVALLGEMVEADKDVPQEVEGHARQISATARETTHALDEIVWTVNPSNDTLDGLINYVCKYAQEYLALAGLRYRLEVPPELPAIPISPELRHNVFLAAKEAINNIVKHSQAASAWLRLSLEPHRFILEIEDNGRGLSSADEKKGRNGLRNMRKRMEDIGGQFDAGAGAEGGVRVRLVAPLRRANP
jgi:signal transduction histidine kinase